MPIETVQLLLCPADQLAGVTAVDEDRGDRVEAEQQAHRHRPCPISTHVSSACSTGILPRRCVGRIDGQDLEGGRADLIVEDAVAAAHQGAFVIERTPCEPTREYGANRKEKRKAASQPACPLSGGCKTYNTSYRGRVLSGLG
jgi:hypothetical protein